MTTPEDSLKAALETASISFIESWKDTLEYIHGSGPYPKRIDVVYGLAEDLTATNPNMTEEESMNEAVYRLDHFTKVLGRNFFKVVANKPAGELVQMVQRLYETELARVAQKLEESGIPLEWIERTVLKK
jgi:hypothetical protein